LTTSFGQTDLIFLNKNRFVFWFEQRPRIADPHLTPPLDEPLETWGEEGMMSQPLGFTSLRICQTSPSVPKKEGFQKEDFACEVCAMGLIEFASF